MAAELSIMVVTSSRDVRRFYAGAIAHAAAAARRSSSGRRRWMVAVFCEFLPCGGGRLRTRLWSRLVCSTRRFEDNPRFVGVLRPDVADRRSP